MKIKFKMPPNHFAELINIVGQLPYERMACSDLDIINLKYFYIHGLEKLNRLRLPGMQKKYPLKARAFQIDVNHYIALKNILVQSDGYISPLTKSVFLGLKTIAEPEILRAVSHFKMIG